MTHSITILYRSDLEIRRLEFDADSRQSIRFAPLMPLCIDDFTWFCVEMSSNVNFLNIKQELYTLRQLSSKLDCTAITGLTKYCLLICPLTV